MAETIVLVTFLLLPLAGIAALWLFFRKFQLHRATRYRRSLLLAGNLLVFLTLLACLLPIGEIYYRWIYDSTDSFGLTKTTWRWFDRHLTLNEDEFRDTVKRYSPQKQSGKKRLVILGDSFTLGQGIVDIEKTFGLQLRKELPEWEVEIHAFLGWDTPEEGDELMRMARGNYEVDVILLAYCLNDISEAMAEWTAIIRSIYGDKDQAGFFVQNSYLLSTLYYRFYWIKHPEVADYFSFLQQAYRGPAWELEEKMLRKLTLLATQNLHVRLLVFTYPMFHALGPDYAFRPVHEQLDQFWTELHVPHLDLLTVFQDRRPDEMVISRIDAHPSELAVAIAAKAVAAFVRANTQ